MSDETSPLPEFSLLLQRASHAGRLLEQQPEGATMAKHDRQALIDLIGFVREYDGLIIDRLDQPSG